MKTVEFESIYVYRFLCYVNLHNPCKEKKREIRMEKKLMPIVSIFFLIHSFPSIVHGNGSGLYALHTQKTTLKGHSPKKNKKFIYLFFRLH